MKNLKSQKPIYYISGILFILFLGVTIYHFYSNRTTINDLKRFISYAYKVERCFIENIPIYKDFATPQKESKLRQFLFDSHIQIAERDGVDQIINDNQIIELLKSGKLENLETGPEKLYYFYNVREKYRYLTPSSFKGLKIITDRFQENLKKKGDVPNVKIAISSVIRPASYQSDLKKKNFNATVTSTHSYGVSFDIFYDNFFVTLSKTETSTHISKVIIDNLQTRMGFLLGDSLRRQLRSILMETLIQLQDEGILYCILERRQRCYHVTILK